MINNKEYNDLSGFFAYLLMIFYKYLQNYHKS